MTATPGPICLIGGTGFLGRALSRHLREQGARLIVVGRSPSVAAEEGERYLSAGELGAREGELSSAGVSAIIDLAYATVPSTSFDDPVADFSQNLASVFRHLELARRLDVGRFLFVSSGGTVYGEGGREPLPESAAKAPLSPYGITKLASEHYTSLFHKVHGLPTIIVRPSNIYGPGQPPFRGQGLVATAFAAALSGRALTVFGDGSQVRDYLSVNDFCAGLIAALTHGGNGETYNLGSGTGTSVRALLDLIGEIVAADGRRLAIDWQDARPFDVACNILDSGKLREAAGWRPLTELRAGLEATWAWIKAQ